MSDVILIIASIVGIATTVYSVIMVINTRKRHYDEYLIRKRSGRCK
jgi:hypothetical protein